MKRVLVRPKQIQRKIKKWKNANLLEEKYLAKRKMLGKGQFLDAWGYIRDGRTGKAIHRTICRLNHGRFPRHFHVHHIDGNKWNNQPLNLIALKPWQHDAIHKKFQMEALPNREWITEMFKVGVRNE